jgi:hypothetical protein
VSVGPAHIESIANSKRISLRGAMSKHRAGEWFVADSKRQLSQVAGW